MATLFEKYKNVNKIGNEVEVPWEVYRFLGIRSLRIFGTELSVGSDDSDYATIEQARDAVAYLVTQLGGQIKWEKL